jgi:hypothetical protein
MNPAPLSARFALGQILVAPDAQEQLESTEVRAALRRHARGDWGEATPDEVADNERGLREDGGVLSIFRDRRDARFGVLTNGNRTATLVVTWTAD